MPTGSWAAGLPSRALYKLPVLFMCENNGYGEFTAQAAHQAISDIADRAVGYGMPGVVVDGMDALAVWEAAGEALDRARRGEGPTLIEAKTYRFYDHVGVKGMRIPYRTEEEVEQWKGRDPIAALEARLADLGVLSVDEARVIQERTLAETAEAIAYAESSPMPTEDDLLQDVYT